MDELIAAMEELLSEYIAHVRHVEDREYSRRYNPSKDPVVIDARRAILRARLPETLREMRAIADNSMRLAEELHQEANKEIARELGIK